MASTDRLPAAAGTHHAMVANFASFVALRPDDSARIESLLGEKRSHAAQQDVAGLSGAGPLNRWCVAAGWAGTVAAMADGRRQVVDLVLPGDVVDADEIGRRGLVLHAFTDLKLQHLGELLRVILADENGPIRKAWSAVHDAAAGRRVAHLVRLGRMMAYERVADFLLELLERQQRSGIAMPKAIIMPLTQDALADYLGLSSVHLNRILQQMRRDGVISYGQGRIALRQPEQLEALAGRGSVD